MAIEITNKLRQMLPLEVIENGKPKQVYLSVGQKVVTEKLTNVMNELVKKGMLKVVTK